MSNLASAVTTALTIAQAVTAALNANPNVLKARERLNQARADLAGAASRAAPVISAQSEALYKKDSLLLGNALFGGEAYNLYNVSAQLRQPLYQGGAFLSGLAIARKEKSVGELELQIAERDVTARVIESFSRLLFLERKTQVLKQTELTQREFLRTAESRLRIGREQRLDVLQFRTQLSLLVPQILETENNLKLEAATLATLLGNEDKPQISARGKLIVPGLERWIAEQRKQPSDPLELSVADIQRDEASDKKDFALAKHWPQLAAVGLVSSNATEKTRLFDSNGRSWAVGLQLTVPLFSGLSSIFERRSLSAAEAQADAERSRIRKSLAFAQVDAQRQIELCAAMRQATGFALTQARAAAEVARRDFRLGTANYLQLFEANRNLFNAEIEQNSWNYNSIRALVRYFTVFNLPLERLTKELSAD